MGLGPGPLRSIQASHCAHQSTPTFTLRVRDQVHGHFLGAGPFPLKTLLPVTAGTEAGEKATVSPRPSNSCELGSVAGRTQGKGGLPGGLPTLETDSQTLPTCH